MANDAVQLPSEGEFCNNERINLGKTNHLYVVSLGEKPEKGPDPPAIAVCRQRCYVSAAHERLDHPLERGQKSRFQLP